MLNLVDVTLGFVQTNQYRMGLAIIEDGVVLGLLGCPNYPYEGLKVMQKLADSFKSDRKDFNPKRG